MRYHVMYTIIHSSPLHKKTIGALKSHKRQQSIVGSHYRSKLILKPDTRIKKNNVSSLLFLEVCGWTRADGSTQPDQHQRNLAMRTL